MKATLISSMKKNAPVYKRGDLVRHLDDPIGTISVWLITAVHNDNSQFGCVCVYHTHRAVIGDYVKDVNANYFELFSGQINFEQ